MVQHTRKLGHACMHIVINIVQGSIVRKSASLLAFFISFPGRDIAPPLCALLGEWVGG